MSSASGAGQQPPQTMRIPGLVDVRQALIDLGFTAECCFEQMEGKDFQEFRAYEILFCLLDTTVSALAERGPQWTREVPTKPGWYFKSRFGFIELCQVFSSINVRSEDYPNTWWHPATVPAPPSGAKESE